MKIETFGFDGNYYIENKCVRQNASKVFNEYYSFLKIKLNSKSSKVTLFGCPERTRNHKLKKATSWSMTMMNCEQQENRGTLFFRLLDNQQMVSGVP